jgi:REP element-mobilizing transposase RayT
MTQKPRRQRRLDRIVAAAPSYFLTLCTDGRAKVLNNTEVLERVQKFASDSSERYGVYVDCFVLMPDHVHLIVIIDSNSATSLGQWIKAFKALVARHQFRWQTGFFDHVLRNDESRSEKWEYIRMNPVRGGLVDCPEDWPFYGRFNRRDGADALIGKKR